MADWGGLPGGVVALLAKRLQLIEDFIAFRSTCSSWRNATSLSDFDKSCPRLPLLLLHPSNYEIDEDHIKERNYFVDRVDENTQIHTSDDDEDYSDDDEDYSEDESDEIVADEVNYEDGKGDENDDVHKSEEIKEKYESDEEKSEIDDNHEIQEDNSDTDENYYDSEEMKENTEIVANEVNYKNGKGDESNGNKVNSETDEETSVESDYEIDKIQEGNSDTSDTDENYSDCREQRMFFSLSKGKGCVISLPEATGMEFRGSKGWLIMVERSTGNMCLFHPLTRARITLPKAPTEVKLPMYPKNIRSGVLSASSSETSDYVVMVAYAEPNYRSGSCVVYCKPGIGDHTWTRVETPAPCVEDLTYYHGKFYALTWRSEVWMCDISGPNPKNKAIKIIELPWKWSRPEAQLVECGGRLLIVAPFFCYQRDMPFYHDLKMVELDVIKGSYSTITSLGSWTVFLGRNEAFSVDTNQFPRGIIEPNRIYFSDRSYRIASRGRDNVPRPDLGLVARGVWINL